MLVSLSVRDVVLIDRLDLAFDQGLCVLTGETGAGKSILLDALGLALGNRAEANLLRPGAAQASVAASFEVPPAHPALAILAEQDILTENEAIVLRRSLGADGRSRAFVNDQPVSAGLLRRLGESLVEVQGQFEQRGLLDAASHRGLLDAYGGLTAKSETVADLWHDWRNAIRAREEAAMALDQARRDEAFLRHAVEELNNLNPSPGEERRLAEQRDLLMNAEQLIEAMSSAHDQLTGGDSTPGAVGGAEATLAGARRSLERAAAKAAGRLDPVMTALERAALEIEEALGQLRVVSADINLDAARQSEIEERLFTLRDLARKHGIEVDALATLRDDLAARLAAIDSGGEHLAALDRALQAQREAYLATAEKLSVQRVRAAAALDQAVDAELPPLKLEKASFHTRVDRLDETGWSAQGLDRIAFDVATNPGSRPGPIAKIASGGELARFLLALKVVLAGIGPRKTLIFDEVDSGIGGATAHAVGERLARLTHDRQVLVVTHSPQVSARGAQHWRVHKETAGNGAATRVSPLSADERQEEIARMLSGAEITEEARAAARRLIAADAV